MPLFVLLAIALATQHSILSPGDAFVEPVSALTFSARVGTWHRTEVLRYPDGSNSVSYEYLDLEEHFRAKATAYIIPKSAPFPRSLKDVFRSTLAEILSLRGDAKVVSESAVYRPTTFGQRVDDNQAAGLTANA
jgi:hypothetical protein